MNTTEGNGRIEGRGTRWWGRIALLLLVIPLGIAGCEEPYYAGRPAYGPGYVAGPGPGYVAAPGPGYIAGPGPSIAVEIGDRPYYTRGAGYYVGQSYYVWRPGHWRYRNGRRFWVHGHYVIR